MYEPELARKLASAERTYSYGRRTPWPSQQAWELGRCRHAVASCALASFLHRNSSRLALALLHSASTRERRSVALPRNGKGGF